MFFFLSLAVAMSEQLEELRIEHFYGKFSSYVEFAKNHDVSLRFPKLFSYLVEIKACQSLVVISQNEELSYREKLSNNFTWRPNKKSNSSYRFTINAKFVCIF